MRRIARVSLWAAWAVLLATASAASALAMDPERTLKLYGDGFAEQRLVDDQIMALTGRRFISGYSSTEDEYQALMDAGVMYARQYQLTPGVALSAEQMAGLTTDIVWLEARTVTLPDGSTTQALVPVVYLRRPLTGDITPTGSLISGSNIELHITGGTNTGTLYANGDGAAGNGRLILTGDTIANSGTFAGHKIVLTADTIDNTGGLIQGVGAGSSAALNARDIILRTTTQTSAAEILGPNGLSTGTRTNVDRIATVSADSVTLAATNNVTLIGASVSASTNLLITATGKITSDAVETGYTLNVPLGGSAQGRSGYMNTAVTTQQLTTLQAGNNLVISAGGDASFKGTNASAVNNLVVSAANVNIEAVKNSIAIDQQGVNPKGYERLATSDEFLAGGNFTAGNNLAVIATGDITAKGASLTADAGQASLIAQGNITLGTLTTEHSTTSEKYTSSSGFLSGKSSERDSSSTTSLAEGSLVSGNTVVVQAGQVGEDGKLVKGIGNITITGSNVVGQQDTTIAAGNTVIAQAAYNTQTTSSYAEDQKSGLGALGGLSYGSKQQSDAASGSATQAVASNLGSVEGNLTISANALSVVGSNLLTPKGDVTLATRSISITEASETSTNDTEFKYKQSGISISISNPILDAARTVGEMGSAASKTDDPRMQALALGTAALSVKGAMDAVSAGGTPNPAAAASIGINLSLGQSKMQSNSHVETDTAVGSNITAGGNVILSATGDGAASTLTLHGSDINAGNLVVLNVDGAVDLGAAQNTSKSVNSNSSSSSSVSIGFNIGAGGNGLTVGVAATKGSGNGSAESTTQVNSHINADAVVVNIGGDATLSGAVINANNVSGHIGGNLLVQSLQDTSTEHQESKTSGFSASVAIIGVGGGASISAGRTNIDGSYQSVVEESGIHAGDGGFQLSVDGNTNLVGGQITSSQKAIDLGNNVFVHGGTITTTDIQNSASYDAKSSGFTLGVGSQLASSRVGVGSADGSASSTTQAGISGIAGNTSLRTGDAASGIAPILNLNAVRSDVNAQVQITGAFGSAASKEIGTYATTQYNKLKDTDPVEAAKWADGGEYRVALHTAVGALTGGVAGAIGAGGSAAIMPEVGKAIDSMDVPSMVRQGLGAITAAAVGSILSGGAAAGAAAAVNVDTNNRQLHTTEITWIKSNASRFATLKGISVAEAERQLSEQAYRQVQFGAEGGAASWDASAQNFLKTAGQQVLPDGGYMFYATPTQRADATMYLDSAVKNAGFYAANGLTIPSAADIQKAADTDAQIRANLGTATKTALAASATVALAGLSPTMLTWALANPLLANAAGVISAETAAAIGSNAVTPTSLISAGVPAASAVKAAEAVVLDVKLSQQISNLRSVLTGAPRTSGNMGVAQIEIAGVQTTMAASSQIDAPTAAQKALGFVGKVPETFPSSVVPTGGSSPYPLLRDVDSEAKILNNIASVLGENTSATGTITLLTERAPCLSCSSVIQQFQAKYPNIRLIVLDNGGANIPPAPRVP